MSKLITDINEIAALQASPFRKASGDGEGTCVEVAPTQGGKHVLIRNSNRPGDGAMLLPCSQFAALVDAIQQGTLDNLQ